MRKVLVPVLLAAIAAASGLTLAHAQSQPQSAPQPGPPAPTAQPPAPGPDAPPAPNAAPDPTFALIQDRCSLCHDASLVTSMHRSPAAWNDLVHSMMRKGANLNDDEAAQVIAYLSKAYGDPPAGS